MIIVIAPYDFWNGLNLLGKGPRGPMNQPTCEAERLELRWSLSSDSVRGTVLWMAALKDQPIFELKNW